MRMGSGNRVIIPSCVLLATMAVSASGAAKASTPSEPAAATAAESAAWAPKELKFTYHGFTTLYTCDGLQQKVKKILIDLGARSDVEVSPWGCTELEAPDPLAGVHIKMNVLQPADASSTAAVSAHWQTVDVLAKRDVVDAAADCELIAQIKQQVLPLFTTRAVDYRATCQAHNVTPGGTRLTAQVLVADRSAATATAAR